MNRGWGGGLLFVFRGDGRRAQKLENRWNCLNSFVRGCRLVREQTGLLFDDFTIHDDSGERLISGPRQP